MANDVENYVNADTHYLHAALCARSVSLCALFLFRAPAWKTYAAQTGDNFSIGLWSACRNNLCTYAWASYSPMTTVNPVTGRMQPALYFQDVTPAMVR